MADWYMYTNYPKASRRVTKGMLLIAIISLSITALYETFIKVKKTESSTITLRGQYSSIQPHRPINNNEICVSVKLMEYPDVLFIYKSDDCNELEIQIFHTEVKTGDSVLLTVNTEDFHKREEQVLFSKLVFNQKILFQNNLMHKQDPNYFVLGLIFTVLFIIGVIIYLILDKKGIIDRMRSKYYEAPSDKAITSIKDYNEFGE